MSFSDDLRAEILGGPPDAWTVLAWLGDLVNHRSPTTPVVLWVDGNPREVAEVGYDEDVEAIFVLARREIGWGGRYSPAAMVAAPVPDSIANPWVDPDPRIAALHQVMARLERDRPTSEREPDDRTAGFAEGLELAISRLNYHAGQLRQTAKEARL